MYINKLKNLYFFIFNYLKTIYFMKKNYFFCAAALAAIALTTGCSKDSHVTDLSDGIGMVSFRVNGDAPQDRPKSTSTTLGYVNAFAVWAQDSIDGTSGRSTVTLFEGESVVRLVGNQDKFDYNPKRFYSTGADLADFYAYSPISKHITAPDFDPLSAPNTAPNCLKFTYEVPLPDAINGNTTQEDLLYAYSHLIPSSSAVVLNFSHALSRVFVAATNSSLADVSIKSLTLKNIATKGIFSFPWDTANDTVGWKSHSEVKDMAWALAESGVTVKASTSTAVLVTSKEQGMMIIPQETQNQNQTDDFSLEVKYDMANLKNQTANIKLKDTFAFKPNSQYVILIKFSGNAITFEVTVTDFTDDFVYYP